MMTEMLTTSANKADYLAQLLKDKKQISAFPNVFMHLERILDEEIGKVRSSLFQNNGNKKEPLLLPDPEGPVVSLSEKIYVPIKEHPDYNFVGRILGPRGMTAKQLELETGCKIMVRGRGSMRDKKKEKKIAIILDKTFQYSASEDELEYNDDPKKEEQNRGKSNWEHLSDDLHVLITVEDTAARAALRIERAAEEIKKLLIPVMDGEDELKKRQLMELAIINGTYRDSSSKTGKSDAPHLMAPPIAISTPLRTPGNPLGAPLILSPRLPMAGATLLNGSAPPPLITPTDAGLLYAPYADYHQYAALAASPLLADFAAEHSTSGAVAKQRRHLALRDHPYQRAGSLS